MLLHVREEAQSNVIRTVTVMDMFAIVSLDLIGRRRSDFVPNPSDHSKKGVKSQTHIYLNIYIRCSVLNFVQIAIDSSMKLKVAMNGQINNCTK
jgi:hypothetical protein